MINPMPKKIVILLPNLGGGGAERMMSNLALKFFEWGHHVEIVLCKKEGIYLERIPQAIKITELNSYHVLPTALKFRKYLKSNNPQYVIAALEYTNAAAVLANLINRKKVKVMASVRCNISDAIKSISFINKLYIKFLIRFFYPKANTLVAISNGVAQDLSKISGIPLKDIKVIYNPAFDWPVIDMALSNEYTHPWLEEKTHKTIIGVGRLMKQKDFITLIKAIQFLLISDKSYKLLILGEGKEENYLNTYIFQNELTDSIEIISFKKNPFVFIAKADVFVLSSIYEGFGNVVVEALACGTQVVATDCPSGPAEILENGKYGFLTPVGDEKAMAKNIEKAIESPIDKRVLVKRAAEFDVNIIAGLYLDAL